MLPEVFEELAKPTQNACISGLLQRCKDYLKLSRVEMVKHYPDWDAYDAVYRGERAADDQDVKARERKEPIKMVVPLTYQQVQTFVSFCYSVFSQRDSFYELAGAGPEDEKAAKVGQAVLERDLNYNRFKSEKITQFLTDIGRFGIGIIKHSWVHETVPVIEQVPDPSYVPNPLLPPTAVPMISQVADKTKFLGNKIIVVNPYRFFPDPRIPITRFREGEFCADEIEYGRGDLEAMEKNKQVGGVEFIPAFRQEDLDGRRLIWIGKDPMLMYNNVPRFVLVSELQLRLNPAKFEYAPGKFLNPLIDREVKCVVWMANDSRIIKLEEMGYAHDDFTYDVAQFTNDQQRFVNFGLAEVLGPLQETISWFINARITSVRKVIQNYLVVDESVINIKDLQDRNPVIRLKRGTSGMDISRYITQLKVQDVTQSHLNDCSYLTKYGQEATGITDSVLGQFASGRRSASEARNVAPAAAGRLLLTAHGIWDSALGPLGQKMLSNLRQGLDEPTLIRIIGGQSHTSYIAGMQALIGQDLPFGQAPLPPTPQGPQFQHVTKADLVGNYDFLVFDGSLPSERNQAAMTLQELLVAMSKDPRLILVFQKDPTLLINEILDLRGIRNAERFNLTTERAQQLMLLGGASGNTVPTGKPKGAGGNANQSSPGLSAGQSQGGGHTGTGNGAHPGSSVPGQVHPGSGR
jgi:hypothetical protein